MDKVKISRMNQVTFSMTDDELDSFVMILETFAAAGMDLVPEHPATIFLAESLLFKLKGK